MHAKECGPLRQAGGVRNAPPRDEHVVGATLANIGSMSIHRRALLFLSIPIFQARMGALTQRARRM
jgi:hypothetical protein